MEFCLRLQPFIRNPRAAAAGPCFSSLSQVSRKVLCNHYAVFAIATARTILSVDATPRRTHSKHVHTGHTRIYRLQTQDCGKGALRCIKTECMRRPQPKNGDTSLQMLQVWRRVRAALQHRSVQVLGPR
ncbi:uncharacterized protein RCC_12160 [Ramularia collo-cygni]|uniref:Uncharacterized protein n=1 Tax=Ramularia collo-cygni TaxID=112498 RepID=A0A2D3V8R8_9PEZI|nr:uncharacterized protein RCC_12160 [Ramularia collo-cygni]CZT21167.1 uncharacterized protein RCC_12160 [Ramularia collo-cygni]